MFTPESRLRLREELIATARADPRITAAAITGSGALGREDRWSDVDLALAVADHDGVVRDWTERMYAEHGAVHHLDVHRGTTLFRVFLLASTLQVDVAFWAPDEFGAIAPTFRLVFGTANELPHARPPVAEQLIGTAWLYALHARSSIERGRVWSAEYMISNMRDNVVSLVCLRHGVPAAQGRGVDDLPPGVAAAFTGTLVRSPDTGELRRAFSAATDLLVAEVEHADQELARRLVPALDRLRSP
ncbi:nucleotidyltransferase domain-containing protein [Lentzea tibetensis]|uniref:Nucleotidyltransferase domain-containing protein n=1 Tax=Lentzea tibetensis TaxID=2591470 RepID=A0A563F344_9PSEU|nr:nucleotidyltransferase domain-containing protein [Lentzea tibetensis]TWP54252.1 nucleotidyltransferase domain-containing protein [Lentzea tibetensis]